MIPKVIYPDERMVSIYGFCGDNKPMLIEKVSINHAPARFIELCHSMGSAWHLVMWKKVNSKKVVGHTRPRRKAKRAVHGAINIL